MLACELPFNVAVIILRNVSSLTSSEPFSRACRRSCVLGISSDVFSHTSVNDAASDVEAMVRKRWSQRVVDNFLSRQIPALAQPNSRSVHHPQSLWLYIVYLSTDGVFRCLAVLPLSLFARSHISGTMVSPAVNVGYILILISVTGLEFTRLMLPYRYVRLFGTRHLHLGYCTALYIDEHSQQKSTKSMSTQKCTGKRSC